MLTLYIMITLRINSLSALFRVLYCEAGCVLQNLMHAVNNKGLMIPLDLGAKGSCMLGGNVSTNAGGLRVIRYGSMHANVLGLEVVLADGTIVDALRGLRKDNCGFQSTHLFIGAEGTLGVITKVALSLYSKPAHTSLALVKVLQTMRYIFPPQMLYKPLWEIGELFSRDTTGAGAVS